MENNENVVSDLYDNYKETQIEIYKMEIRKVRNSIFWVAGLFLFSAILSLLITNNLTAITILFSLIFPLIFVGVGLLAMKEPLPAIIIAIFIFLGLMVWEFVITNGRSAISGWLIKAALVYFLLAGLQSAREARKISKEMA